MCDSILIEPNKLPTSQTNGNIFKEQSENISNPPLKMTKILEPAVTKTMQANKKLLVKNPRPTKASLARMSINKPVKDSKKANLAISFENAASKKDEKTKKTKEELKSIYSRHFSSNKENVNGEEESPLRLPVKIRVCNEPKISLNNNLLDEKETIESNEEVEKIIKMDTSNLQPYCPDYYSDASVDESFFNESNKTCPVNKESTVCEEGNEDEDNEVDEGIGEDDEDICNQDEAKLVTIEAATEKRRFSPDISFDASLNLSLDEESFVVVAEKKVEIAKQKTEEKKSGATLFDSFPVKTENVSFEKEVQLIKKMEKERLVSKSDTSTALSKKDDSDLDKKTKDALYELVLTQQEQLSKLQSQVGNVLYW